MLKLLTFDLKMYANNVLSICKNSKTVLIDLL